MFLLANVYEIASWRHLCTHEADIKDNNLIKVAVNRADYESARMLLGAARIIFNRCIILAQLMLYLEGNATSAAVFLCIARMRRSMADSILSNYALLFVTYWAVVRFGAKTPQVRTDFLFETVVYRNPQHWPINLKFVIFEDILGYATFHCNAWRKPAQSPSALFRKNCIMFLRHTAHRRRCSNFV